MITIEEALETLYTSGMLDRLYPGMGKEYISLNVVVENEGEETVLVMVVKDKVF